MTALPSIIAPDRGALRAFTVPAVQRMNLLGTHLDQRGFPLAGPDGERRILALVGEGGIGKSVLLGQCLDRLAANPGQAVVLVGCASVEPTADMRTLDDVDRAFGQATEHPHGEAAGLLSL